jgi:NTE family protein
LIISATDIDTRRSVHLTEGPLAEAVVASSAINGIFPPVRFGDRRLADGIASDPVPTGVLRAAGADIVIAVNVMNIGRGATGLYKSRLRIPIPGLIDNLMTGLDTVITRTAVLSCKLADVIVEPDDAGADWYEVLPAAKYSASGRRAMEVAVPAVRALLAGEASGSVSVTSARARPNAAT